MKQQIDWQTKAETEKEKVMFLLWCIVKLLIWLALVLIGSFIGSFIGYCIVTTIEGAN